MKGLVTKTWVTIGESAKLVCDYDLGRDAMYSIKWFKDNAELYRYIPTNQPQYKSFQTPGALVDETLSKPNMLMLRITGPLGSGLYKCEVTTETPSFLTHSANASLTVMTPPLTPPTIVGVANFYNSGDLVDINCTSFESKPTANLTWNVNDQPAKEGTFLPPHEFLNSSSGLETTTSTLRFVAEPQHFPNGRMKLTCMAKLDDLWDDKITKTAYGAGDEGQPKHLIISNYAGCQQTPEATTTVILVTLLLISFLNSRC